MLQFIVWLCSTIYLYQVFLPPFFRSCLEYDLSLTDEQTVRHVEVIVLMGATAVTEMKHLFFIGSIYDSIKVWYQYHKMYIFIWARAA